MLRTAASSGRLHPCHVLALAGALVCVSFVLHGQWQTHSQLAAARAELRELRSLVAHGSSSSSSSSGTTHEAGTWRPASSSDSKNGVDPHALQQLIGVVQAQQRLLSSSHAPGANQHQHLQEDADRLIKQLLAAPGGASSQQQPASVDRAAWGPASSATASTQQQQAADVNHHNQQQQEQLEQESPFWRTQLQLRERQAGAHASNSMPPGTLCLDMTELLGLPKFMTGITWEPKNCFTGLATVFSDSSAGAHAALKQRLLADLTAAAARARGVQPADINATAMWWAALKGAPPSPQKAILSDPAFVRWQVGVVRVLSRYMVRADNKNAAVPCPGAPWSEVTLTPDDLPLPACDNLTDVGLVEQVGRHGQPFDSLATIANVAVAYGLCTVPTRDGHASYGEFLMDRATSSKWRTFDSRSLAEDTVVFLWDLLYQTREVFFRQRWLGVAAMQAPFDFLAIADIIHETQPDVILETGTANGGSALMWASLLELNGLHNSTVVTVDIAPPGAAHAFGADSKAPAQLVTATGQVIAAPKRRPQVNPVEHHLWRRYVRFVQGSSTEPATVMQVKAILAARQQRLVQAAATPAGEDGVADAAASYGGSMSASISSEADAAAATASAAASPSLRVLVLLDSHHSALHVLGEMEAYCGLVSPGSFCIIEDTKLTRWTNSDAGPLESVRSFVSLHPEFRVQRDRELLFTHHPYGYLQRLY